MGSAFKLCVLAAVSRAVASGRLRWEQVFAFKEQWRSLPTGILQSWPNAVPLTLMSLCCLMVSLSDNTAADALIQIVGREAVESISPFNRPFITTREAFILKADKEPWAQMELTQRRSLLAELADRALPNISELSGCVGPDVEWFFSADELCALLLENQHHPSMAINPGPVLKSRWKRVAFKGGREPAVLNISLLMIDHDAQCRVLVVTHNAAEEFDQEAVLRPVRAIARLLEDRI